MTERKGRQLVIELLHFGADNAPLASTYSLSLPDGFDTVVVNAHLSDPLVWAINRPVTQKVDAVLIGREHGYLQG